LLLVTALERPAAGRSFEVALSALAALARGRRQRRQQALHELLPFDENVAQVALLGPGRFPLQFRQMIPE